MMIKKIQKQLNDYKKNGNNEAIIKLLLPLSDEHNQLIYEELLDAYQRSGMHKDILSLCKKFEISKKNIVTTKWISSKAVALVALNLPLEAKKVLEEGAKHHPNDSEINHNYSVCLANIGIWDEALRYAQIANKKLPNHSAILGNLGRILIALKKTDEAKNIFTTIIKHSPKAVDGYNGMGAAFLLEYDIEPAIQYLEKANQISPTHASTLGNLGVAYKTIGKYEDARNKFEAAIQNEPKNTEHHWNLALLDLLLGNYERGWREYEWRHHPDRTAYDRVTKPDVNIPMLTNSDNVKGKVVGMMAEQGFGDNIQFSRYAKLLKEEGAIIVIMSPDPLIPVMQTLPWADSVCNRWSTCPKLDFWVYPMSLPQRYKTTITTIPNQVPYLFAQQSNINHWTQKLGAKVAKLRIGIVWAGRPGHGNDKNRSMHLSDFKNLFDIDSVEFISLQTGVRGNETLSGINLKKFGDEIKTFADSAAILTQLDLLITVDSAPAHLAGALGCPVWILIPYNPDFRWLLERTDSPWYGPNMKLYRQNKEMGWDEVIGRIKHDLIALVNNPIKRNAIAYPDIAWTPDQANASGVMPLLQVAIWHHQKNELDAAANIYRFVLQYCPDNTDALRNLAACMRAQGKPSEAEEFYKKCLDLKGNDALAHANYANLLADIKKMEQAEHHALKAIELDPMAHNAWYILSVVYQHDGKNQKAVDAINKALDMQPENIIYITMKGINLIGQKNLSDARKYLEKAKAINPNHTEMLVGFGQLETEAGNAEEALVIYQRLLENTSSIQQSLRTEILNSRAMAYARTGEYKKAIADAKTCTELMPENPDAHFNLAIYSLTLADFKTGWKEYEWRYHPERKAHDRIIPMKLKTGKQWLGENLDGKSILISPEQGHGDNIQFMRYAMLLKESGATVYILTAESLRDLFGMQSWQDGTYFDSEKVPAVDYWVLPLSLPYRFNTELKTIPASIPYIRVEEKYKDLWRKRLDSRNLLNKPLIILVNSGSALHKNDKNRSIPLNQFENLLELSDFNFAVIDHQARNNDRLTCGNYTVDNLGSMVESFTDTAVIFSMAKYIVSIDSATLHLAGAMGLPCCGLIPSSPDWRWMLDRNDTPWYPTMKLFRQELPSGWKLVLEKVKLYIESNKITV